MSSTKDIKRMREFFASAPKFRMQVKRLFTAEFLKLCVDDISRVVLMQTIGQQAGPSPLEALGIGLLLDTAGIELPGDKGDPDVDQPGEPPRVAPAFKTADAEKEEAEKDIDELEELLDDAGNFARIEGDEIVIRLKVDVLAEPSVMPAELADDRGYPKYKVVDPEKFAKSFVHHLNADLNDSGDTLITNAFDRAFYQSVEDPVPGKDGVVDDGLVEIEDTNE